MTIQQGAYEYQGVRGLSAIADFTGIPFGTLKGRLYKSGMSLERAIAVGRPLKHHISQDPDKDLHRTKKTVGVRYPDLLDSKWKLALGMRNSL